MNPLQLQYRIHRLEMELGYTHLTVETKASIQDEITRLKLILNRLKTTVIVN